jgi:Arc/MetJ-type ribon-helix-helix transcriptional regulator
MHRIQVQLTQAQERQLRDMARLRKVSISALIREGVERLLAPANDDWERIKADALAAVGSCSLGIGDLAQNHDECVAQALLDDLEANRP